jgi:hypothetical protein
MTQVAKNTETYSVNPAPRGDITPKRSERNEPAELTIDEQKVKLAQTLNHRRKKEAELVRGIFRNYENPGGYLGFTAPAFDGKPGKEEANKKWEFWDTKEYTIPRGLAFHLNNNLKYPVYRNLDIPGVDALCEVESFFHRVAFHPIGFDDFDDIKTQVELAKVKTV